MNLRKTISFFCIVMLLSGCSVGRILTRQDDINKKLSLDQRNAVYKSYKLEQTGNSFFGSSFRYGNLRNKEANLINYSPEQVAGLFAQSSYYALQFFEEAEKWEKAGSIFVNCGLFCIIGGGVSCIAMFSDKNQSLESIIYGASIMIGTIGYWSNSIGRLYGMQQICT